MIFKSMDSTPGHNQLMMMLKKRESFGENELYEMMRSRQVYKVQTELRKELERNVQALKRAEKLKVAGFVAQRDAFLRRVERREKSKQHLVNVRLELEKILNLPDSGKKSESNPSHLDGTFQREIKTMGFDTARGAVGLNNVNAVKNVEFIHFRVKTNRGVEQTSDSLTSSEKRGEMEPRDSKGEGVKGYNIMVADKQQQQHHGCLDTKTVRQKGVDQSSDDSVVNEDRSKSNTTRIVHNENSRNVPALSVTSEEDGQWDGKSENERPAVKEVKKVGHGDGLMTTKIDAGIEHHWTSNSNNQLKARRNILPPLRLNSVGVYPSQTSLLSPRDCLKIKTSHVETTSTEQQTNAGHPLSPSSDLVRAITMVFVEEKEEGDLSPKSLFDFEAWLAYNRRKRGYSRIVGDATRSTADMDGHFGDAIESQNDRNRLGGHVTLKLSKASPRNLRMAKTFREKSNEWYLTFLESRRIHNKNKDSKEKREVRTSHDSMLPEIETWGNSLIHGTEKDRNTMGRVSNRETTAQRLQKMREEFRLLEVKVHNFLYS